MTIDKKAAQVASTGTASNNTIDKPYSTKADPLLGFNLAKPSRNRQPKRSWKRSKQRGRIDAYLAAQLALLIVLIVLTVGGVKS